MESPNMAGVITESNRKLKEKVQELITKLNQVESKLDILLSEKGKAPAEKAKENKENIDE